MLILCLSGKVHVGRKDVTLTVYDCSSEDEHLGIRSFAYQDTDVCILCYSVADRDSFENIRSKWSEEIRNLVGQKVPIVLVATQTDLRNNKITQTLFLQIFGHAAISKYRSVKNPNMVELVPP